MVTQLLLAALAFSPPSEDAGTPCQRDDWACLSAGGFSLEESSAVKVNFVSNEAAAPSRLDPRLPRLWTTEASSVCDLLGRLCTPFL
jgi:hypothetical protein